ncbi:alpha/beta hydrolase [Planococcus shenhongbingii]|uniref:Alpha/beta fold hydrolase n=1 Tax=Planococcus shenhongbingii TaxID=3058398 RepID=A0ABT8NCM1_9BACL|nr:alpha/beta fold hydrolase [Planococcus sp. N017]MDN7245637.1 alpha/beta fold hydrolase [Planococcus sp. N017]
MMKLLPPKPFYYEGGEQAVLLLHSFTSNPGDMKKLGRHLQKNQYSCCAPVYSGHGLPAEDLLTYGPSDWWQDALGGYQLLKDKGFDQIAVIGLSLGGVLALKAAQELEVAGVVTMSVPIQREAAFLQKRVFHYAKRYKQLEGKDEDQIRLEMDNLHDLPVDSLDEFQQLIDRTRDNLTQITSPIRILYGELDEPLYQESAEVIFQSVASDHKTVKGYPNSKHLMTLGADMDDVNKDVLAFLNELTWQL